MLMFSDVTVAHLFLCSNIKHHDWQLRIGWMDTIRCFIPFSGLEKQNHRKFETLCVISSDPR